MKKFIFHFCVFFIFITYNLTAQTTYYVKKNGTGDGLSWASASGNIQEMIDKAIAGDQIWVAKGTYYPTKELIARDNRSKTFAISKNVRLYGGFEGNESSIKERKLNDLDSNGKIELWEFENTTILSGNIDSIEDIFEKKYYDGFRWEWETSGNKGNSYHVVTMMGSSNLIDGFRIEGGNSYYTDKNAGGGIYSSHYTNVVIRNCEVCYNEAIDGGGIYGCDSIINCYVHDCSGHNDGGGINHSKFIINSKISNCSISRGRGGGVFLFGSYSATILRMTQCIIQNCSAPYGKGGGGVYEDYGVGITYCLIMNCSSCRGGGVLSRNTYAYEAGFYNFISNCTIINCSALNSGAAEVDYAINCNAFNCYASEQNFGNAGIYTNGHKKNCAEGNNKLVKDTTTYGNYFNINETFIKPTSFIGIATTEEEEQELINADFSLKEGSKCINAGIKDYLIPNSIILLPQGNLDINGDSSKLYGEYDIGAYEFVIKKIDLPVIENFDTLTNFGNSKYFYGYSSLNVPNTFWKIEDKKVKFDYSNNMKSYNASFFTYQIDATDIVNVELKYTLTFQSYSGWDATGSEKLIIEYSTDMVNWKNIATYYDSDGDKFNEIFTHNLSDKLSHKTFFIRFTAKGADSNRIEKWELDNIKIDTTDFVISNQNLKSKDLNIIVNEGKLIINNVKNFNKFQLFDINGKELLNLTLDDQNKQIQLPSKGFYIVRFNSNNDVYAKKIVW